eukprot:gene3089-3634_t
MAWARRWHAIPALALVASAPACAWPCNVSTTALNFTSHDAIVTGVAWNPKPLANMPVQPPAWAMLRAGLPGGPSPVPGGPRAPNPYSLRLASSSRIGEVKVWDRAGKVILGLPVPDASLTVAWSPGGGLIAVGGYWGLKVFHAGNGTTFLAPTWDQKDGLAATSPCP